MPASADGRRRRLALTLTAAMLASVTATTTAATAQDAEAPPTQYPFACTVQDHGLGQPLVDNHDGEGVPVYAEDEAGQPTEEIVGYSRDCDAPTRTWYYAVDTTGRLHVVRDHGEDGPSSIADALPDGVEVAMIEPDGVDGPVPYLIRHERGVINRFIYSTSMLAPDDEVLDGDPSEPDRSLWNQRLLFQFQGGVGIGHSQGRFDDGGTRARAIKGDPDRLALGDAVIYSTATRTGDHYNLLVGGRTAAQVKDHFVATHGEPRYTVALGGSGGAIQQYVYNQNHPGLLDAAVPQMTYPDMTTQTIHVGDCALLDRWMDVDRADDERWRDWDERRVIQGLNSIEGYLGSTAQQLAQIQAALGQEPQTGSSECLEGWFGLSPLAMNPTFGSESNWELLGDQVDDIERTHWSDAVEAYGLDPETGFARVPWDNVGVQYGLRALTDGELSVEEFLDLNARVGSWKDTPDMVEEGFPFVGTVADLMADPTIYDPWSARNQQLSPDGGVTPAPRRTGDLVAIANAYTSGLVTLGAPEREIPIIDVREHMEHVLDMHNVHQSFAARQRLLDGQGHADNQAIWFLATDENGNSPAAADFYHHALDTIDAWIGNLEADPSSSVAEARPDDASDRCFDVAGDQIAAGDDVWGGILDDGEEGPCTQAFDVFTTSRIEAGGPITGDVYKCHTMPVDTAVAEGLYGDWQPSSAELDRLRAIHPDGVCDYGLRGVADPRADVADAPSATGVFGTLRVTGADPGARVQVRRDGEVVASTTAAANGTASVRGLDDATYVVAQERGGERGLLSQPVAFTASGFTDVPSDHPHLEGILALAGDGIMFGWSDGTFRPQRHLTRAQLASTMQRMLQLPAGPTGVFPDVHPDSVHTEAIEALAHAGVIAGFPDGRFGPDEPIRRDQLASLVARAAGIPDAPGRTFADTVGSPHAGAIEALTQRGVIRGYQDGTYRPRLPISRAQVATILHGARSLLE